MRARVAHTCRHSLARGHGCRRGRTERRFDTCNRIYIFVCACVPRLHKHYPFICTCENRPGLCMRAPVCDGDGSAVCARVGGLVLRARPKPRNPKPCEPLPSAWTACGFGAQAFNSASAFNADIGAWNIARVTTLNYVCAAPGPGGVHYGGRARPGFECGAAGCARRHRRCARACAHVQALACAGPWV
jgi:hypothetical protein